MKRTSPWIIWWAIAVHLVWGLALLIDTSISPVAILVGMHWLIALGVGSQPLGAMLIVAALVAALGLLLDHRVSSLTGILMLMPQYFLLVAAFVSDSQSVISSTVDGREIDRLLLLTALWPVMIAAVLHSIAIIERHVQWNRL